MDTMCLSNYLLNIYIHDHRQQWQSNLLSIGEIVLRWVVVINGYSKCVKVITILCQIYYAGLMLKQELCTYHPFQCLKEQ